MEHKAKLNPDYGYPVSLRLGACKLALEVGVTKAAALYNVTPPSVYNWLKVYTCAEVLKGKESANA